jgi:hypothetical protein
MKEKEFPCLPLNEEKISLILSSVVFLLILSFMLLYGVLLACMLFHGV